MLYRLHEWLAERFRFVQFPPPRARLISRPRRIDGAFTWGLFVAGMILIWGSAPVWIALIVVAILLFGR